MKQTITNPDGSKTEGPRLWGVTFVPAKSRARSFCNSEGEFNEAAWERAMETRTDKMLNGGGKDPLECTRSAHYIVQIRALGRVRYVGLRYIPRKAGKLFDSALFYLWGFLKRPQPRFNFLDPLTQVPEEYPEVTQLRKSLVLELRKKGVDPAQFNCSYGDCLREEAAANAAEEERKRIVWEEMQRKHL